MVVVIDTIIYAMRRIFNFLPLVDILVRLSSRLIIRWYPHEALQKNHAKCQDLELDSTNN